MAVLCRLRAAAPSLKRFLATRRSYGCAAAAQLQYDDHWDHEDHQGNLEMGDAEGSESVRGVQWVILGDPMAKKHLYADRLSKLVGVPHISMGTLVRQELHPHSSLYKQIANAVNLGKLVPEDVIFGLLSKRLEEGYCRGETGFLLDGLPRTRIQAEILDQIADVDLVVNLKCTEDCLVTKQPGPEIYPACREFLSLGGSGLNLSLQSENDPMKPSTATFADGAKLRAHAEQSKPLEDYYRKQKKLVDFQVVGTPGETWRGLLAALHLQHMNGVSSSQKLTA